MARQQSSIDHIIVGQGLAGSCLALELIKRGKKILVFDEPENNRASIVAAGLFNPISGKRLAPAWMADEIFARLFQFYNEAEKLLDEKFFYPMSLYRPFISVNEQNEWMARSERTEIKKITEAIFTKSVLGNQVNDDFGGIRIKQTGYIDAHQFIQATRKFLLARQAYRAIHFDSTQLKISENKIDYEACEATSIIFCEGMNSKNNPLFNWVPVIPLKGETLTIAIAEKIKTIFNRGVYLVPDKENNWYRAGATYRPNDATEGTTSEARIALESKIKKLMRLDFEIVKQEWGIRPSTADRRPIVGAHPAYKNVLIFNGLGTKGVSLSPYFSALLANWLEGRAEILNEVNIKRFNSLHFGV